MYVECNPTKEKKGKRNSAGELQPPAFLESSRYGLKKTGTLALVPKGTLYSSLFLKLVVPRGKSFLFECISNEKIKS